ncbi:MAG TPA: ROK family protein, partial [Acidimicrobiales bacterium]|nr:ROK family protein [Acidimicrobiales bacterium]
AEERRDTRDHGAEIVDDLASVCEHLLRTFESGFALAEADTAGGAGVVCVGVGIPGLVDREGLLRFAPNLLGANGTQIRAGLQSRLGDRVRVHVDNDATSAVVGECRYGAGVGRDDVLFVTVGTGIGGGIVTGGRLLRGSANFAAEIGHVVVDPHGPLCGCGRRGCWERYASGSGLGRLARDAALAGRADRVRQLAGGDSDDVRGEHVVLAAAEGDQDAAAILEEFAWWLALGLGNLANILDPEIIVIGGGLVTAGEALFAPVRAAFPAHLEAPTLRPAIEIVPAALGEHGGAIGAAVLARSSPAQAGEIGPAAMRSGG